MVKLLKVNIEIIIVIIFVISILAITKIKVKNEKFNDISEYDMNKYVEYVKCNIPYNNSCNKKMDDFYEINVSGGNIRLVPPSEEEEYKFSSL